MTTTNLRIGQQVKGSINDIAFGGSGLLKIEGFVLFVPFTAPGDEIVAEITLLKKGYGEAKIVEIVKSSPFRITPKCPYFGTCMGCQFQHIEYSAQLEIKRKNVEDALVRIGKLDTPNVTIVPSNQEYAYRERITLHLKNGKMGYVLKDNISLLDISTCPIFAEDPELFKILHILFRNDSGRLQITKDKTKGYLIFGQLENCKSPKTIIDESASFKQIVGIHVKSNGKTYQRGIDTLHSSIDDLNFEYSPQTFIQNNYKQSLNIYRDITEWLEPDHKILDLYSGIGITSLLLALKGKDVIAIEANKYSVKFAKENALRNHLKARFETGLVEELIDKALSTQIDAVIMNPPREGVHNRVLNALLEKKVKKVVYISCMPSTLARDLKLLKEPYKIEAVKAFDMFPQTAHVETVVKLKSE